MWKIWLLVAGFFLILEAATSGFLVLWFAVSAVITMLFSLFITSKIVQFTIFVVLSIVLIFATQPLVKKLTKNSTNIKTNAFSIEGKTAKVTIDIDPIEGTGQIKLNSEKWSAKSANDSFISEGTEVKVISIEGVRAIVEPIIK